MLEYFDVLLHHELCVLKFLSKMVLHFFSISNAENCLFLTSNNAVTGSERCLTLSLDWDGTQGSTSLRMADCGNISFSSSKNDAVSSSVGVHE